MPPTVVTDIFVPSTHHCFEDKAAIEQRQVDRESLAIDDVRILSGERIFLWKY